MRRKQRIKELETELRIVKNYLIMLGRKNGYHARYNHFIKQYWNIIQELESISIKWKIKKIIRRIKSWRK